MASIALNAEEYKKLPVSKKIIVPEVAPKKGWGDTAIKIAEICRQGTLEYGGAAASKARYSIR